MRWALSTDVPGNILLFAVRRLRKVVDFGLASAAEGGEVPKRCGDYR